MKNNQTMLQLSVNALQLMNGSLASKVICILSLSLVGIHHVLGQIQFHKIDDLGWLIDNPTCASSNRTFKFQITATNMGNTAKNGTAIFTYPVGVTVNPIGHINHQNANRRIIFDKFLDPNEEVTYCVEVSADDVKKYSFVWEILSNDIANFPIIVDVSEPFPMDNDFNLPITCPPAQVQLDEPFFIKLNFENNSNRDVVGASFQRIPMPIQILSADASNSNFNINSNPGFITYDGGVDKGKQIEIITALRSNTPGSYLITLDNYLNNENQKKTCPVEVVGEVVPEGADIQVIKKSSKDTVLVGEAFEFCLTIKK